MASVLTLANVSKTFYQNEEANTLFDGLSYEFKQGASHAITGISGTGKSTLLALLAGIEKPTKGSIFFDEHDVLFLSQANKYFYQHKLGIVFQVPHLIRELSVIQNIAIKGILAGMPLHEYHERACELLEEVGLGAKGNISPASLSGGEQQRIAVARALFFKPTFLLADEPTAHIDEMNKGLILALIKKHQNSYGMGIILSTHDPYVAQHMDIHLTIQGGALRVWRT